MRVYTVYTTVKQNLSNLLPLFSIFFEFLLHFFPSLIAVSWFQSEQWNSPDRNWLVKYNAVIQGMCHALQGEVLVQGQNRWIRSLEMGRTYSSTLKGQNFSTISTRVACVSDHCNTLFTQENLALRWFSMEGEVFLEWTAYMGSILCQQPARGSGEMS